MKPEQKKLTWQLDLLRAIFVPANHMGVTYQVWWYYWAFWCVLKLTSSLPPWLPDQWLVFNIALVGSVWQLAMNHFFWEPARRQFENRARFAVGERVFYVPEPYHQQTHDAYGTVTAIHSVQDYRNKHAGFAYEIDFDDPNRGVPGYRFSQDKLTWECNRGYLLYRTREKRGTDVRCNQCPDQLLCLSSL